MKIKVFPKHRLTPTGQIATRKQGSLRDNAAKYHVKLKEMTDEEILQERLKARNSKGQFVKGSNGGIARGNARLSSKKSTRKLMKELQKLLLEKLMSKDNQDKILVEKALETLAQSKPEHVLQLASKLIPKEQNIEKKVKHFAPLILNRNEAQQKLISKSQQRNTADFPQAQQEMN